MARKLLRGFFRRTSKKPSEIQKEQQPTPRREVTQEEKDAWWRTHGIHNENWSIFTQEQFEKALRERGW